MSENENAFKNLINPKVVNKISNEIKRHYPSFNQRRFQRVSRELAPLELKARVLKITEALKENLPEDYPEALKILVAVIKEENLSGFELWPFSEYISQFGLDDFDRSMKAMYELTQRFTSEFAIRPYLIKNYPKVMKYFHKWASDKNVHVRRWVSEGTRPLLPWGMKLPLFVMDPTPGLLLLDKLKFDDELYVRKSVANHLNDITKNHPEAVIGILRLWEKDVAPENLAKLQWIKKHSLRTLIKKGHAGALKLMGVQGKADVKISNLKLTKKNYSLHDKLDFSFNLTAKKNEKLIIDYAIDFVKSNGSVGQKVFKLKSVEVKKGDELEIRKSHSLRPITTMKYYSGNHHLSIQINGEVAGKITFNLKI